MLVAKEYTLREDYIIFKCSYTQSINSFNISSTLKAGVDSRTTWQIQIDYELKNTDPSITHNSIRDPGPYDINNLCSFNDTI